jgi:hypothetical protein
MPSTRSMGLDRQSLGLALALGGAEQGAVELLGLRDGGSGSVAAAVGRPLEKVGHDPFGGLRRRFCRRAEDAGMTRIIRFVVTQPCIAMTKSSLTTTGRSRSTCGWPAP